MRRLRGVSRSGWVVVGLVVGAIVVPAVAVAATITVVQVKGGGNSAFVSPANQLRATEMDPSYNFHHAGFSAGGACSDMGVISAGRASVIKQLLFNASFVDGSVANYATLYAGPGCTGPAIEQYIDFDRRGVSSLPLGAGVTLAANTPLSLYVKGGSGYVDVYGYTVSAAAAPATAGLRSRIGPTSVRRPAHSH